MNRNSRLHLAASCQAKAMCKANLPRQGHKRSCRHQWQAKMYERLMAGMGSHSGFRLLAESGKKLTDRYWQTQSFNTPLGNDGKVPRCGIDGTRQKSTQTRTFTWSPVNVRSQRKLPKATDFFVPMIPLSTRRLSTLSLQWLLTEKGSKNAICSSVS